MYVPLPHIPSSLTITRNILLKYLAWFILGAFKNWNWILLRFCQLRRNVNIERISTRMFWWTKHCRETTWLKAFWSHYFKQPLSASFLLSWIQPIFELCGFPVRGSIATQYAKFCSKILSELINRKYFSSFYMFLFLFKNSLSISHLGNERNFMLYSLDLSQIF